MQRQKTVVVRSRGLVTIPRIYRQELNIEKDMPLVSGMVGGSIVLAKSEKELKRIKEAYKRVGVSE